RLGRRVSLLGGPGGGRGGGGHIWGKGGRGPGPRPPVSVPCRRSPLSRLRPSAWHRPAATGPRPLRRLGAHLLVVMAASKAWRISATRSGAMPDGARNGRPILSGRRPQRPYLALLLGLGEVEH